jgi:hypothetical protein
MRPELEVATDEAIAACGGNARDAVKALIVANEYFEAEVCDLMQAVSKAFVRGRFKGRLAIVTKRAVGCGGRGGSRAPGLPCALVEGRLRPSWDRTAPYFLGETNLQNSDKCCREKAGGCLKLNQKCEGPSSPRRTQLRSSVRCELLRARKDGHKHRAEHHPSRRAQDGGHLTGERFAFVPGMTQRMSLLLQEKTRRIRKIRLDSILLSCPSCQCVAAIALDREGKSAAYFLPSRAP